jgi:hypothetical protein
LEADKSSVVKQIELFIPVLWIRNGVNADLDTAFFLSFFASGSGSGSAFPIWTRIRKQQQEKRGSEKFVVVGLSPERMGPLGKAPSTA